MPIKFTAQLYILKLYPDCYKEIPWLYSHQARPRVAARPSCKIFFIKQVIETAFCKQPFIKLISCRYISHLVRRNQPIDACCRRGNCIACIAESASCIIILGSCKAKKVRFAKWDFFTNAFTGLNSTSNSAPLLLLPTLVRKL